MNHLNQVIAQKNLTMPDLIFDIPYESIVYVFTSDRQKSKTGKKINKLG